jgi:ATP-binding cassette, subfamily F, member 3
MIEISLKKVQKYYGATKVLENITFDLKTGQKIGIVGLNGSGKTTLFKIICGIEKYEDGMVAVRKGATIGYLEQLPEYLEKCKVIDVLYSAFEDVLEIKGKMDHIEKQMKNENSDKLDKLIKKYGEIQEKFEHLGGYNIEHNIKRVCIGLKINEEFQQRTFNTLSGGEKTIVLLGKILLHKSDILLLDEPSNHLDIESLEWLEEFLKEYQGTILIISHDRYFMDRVAKKIVEIENGKSTIYHGNYSYYVKEKKNRGTKQLALFNIQQKKIQAINTSITRLKMWEMRGGSGKYYIKAASMQKRLNKMEKIEKPSLDQNKMKLNFSVANKSEEEVLEIRGLSKSFDNKTLFKNLDIKVLYGEKLAILGKNGSGKTTLAKILVKEYVADEGVVEMGSEVKVGYLAQNVTFNNMEQTILEEFREDITISQQAARSALAKFLFTRDDVFKKINTLSGGERSRLRLCKLMQQDVNLLILDEPTNHFDINSREIIEKALTNFQGTIICISHDRYFIKNIAKRAVELTEEGIIEYKLEDLKEEINKVD